MKRNSKHHKQHSQIGGFGKLFGILAICTFTFFVVAGFASWIQAKVFSSPSVAMNGISGTISSDTFLDMLGMEVAYFGRNGEKSTFSVSKLSPVVMKMLTGVNPFDPKSLLAGEISGMGGETFLIRSGAATDITVYPTDSAPQDNLLQPVPQEENPNSADSETGINDPIEPAPDDTQPTPTQPENKEQLTTNGIIRAFIYHSHNRESWLPELEGVTELADAYDPTVNITLLGKRLAEQLEKDGIGSAYSDKDYPSTVKDFNYNYSYKYSLKTVEEAAAMNEDLDYYFDIHRDSQTRDLTTATIDGVDYAQVYFIIGHKNSGWQDNEEFARKIHDVLEKKYPGLSRGIYGKNASGGTNGEYNQHISPHAILIEVGGPENNLEESYRTIDVLSDAISEVFWEAEKVDTSGKEPA